MQIPYQKALDILLARLDETGERPTLLLHCCCAPCSSYVLQSLHAHFRLVLFFYNPNISPQAEYDKRLAELRRMLADMGLLGEVHLIEGRYEPERFFAAVRGLEDAPEGGARCRVCFSLRLGEAARKAAEIGADYFCTTLSISPHKDAELLAQLSRQLSDRFHIPWLPSDFKKKGGYQASIALSRQYGLYRQDYCGCVFSKAEAERRRADHTPQSVCKGESSCNTPKN